MFGCIGVYPSARAGDQHHLLRRQLSERGDLVPLAQAFPGALRRPTREDRQGSRSRLFKRLGAHRGLRERERGRYRVGEGVPAGSPVLVDLNACAEGLNDKTLEDIQSTRCFTIFSGRLPCPEPKLSVF